VEFPLFKKKEKRGAFPFPVWATTLIEVQASQAAFAIANKKKKKKKEKLSYFFRDPEASFGMQARARRPGAERRGCVLGDFSYDSKKNGDFSYCI
jgi:hypothetical protein